MSRKNKYLALICMLFLTIDTISAQVKQKDGFFYIDDRKFFIKGIGYEVGAQPGLIPYDRKFDAEQLHFDMQRIVSGGYNTIRTWGIFTKEELDVIKNYDLKIIMGIWIDPAGNFSDENYIREAKKYVKSVMSYSRNYDNIIGYIIMNEPHPSVILGPGYKHTVKLWRELTEIIQTNHPGRGVSIANTPNGTYAVEDVFNYDAYNVYIYNPVTVHFLHQFKDHIAYLKTVNDSNRPFIVTEFGLPVSPEGPGNWGYGGNTPKEQAEGDVFMYKALVDGGASGACIFSYSDGWSKTEGPFTEFLHSDHAEEWFGLVEYEHVNDKKGTTRPAWDAVKQFQSAIITLPRSEEIYTGNIPLEVFPNAAVKKMRISIGDNILYEKELDADYLADTLSINAAVTDDCNLLFSFYDAAGTVVKQEEKHILIMKQSPILPEISLQVNDDLWQNNQVQVHYTLTNDGNFRLADSIDYVYYPHIDYDYGYKFSKKTPDTANFQFDTEHAIEPSVRVITVGAAIDVYYKTFRKRIYHQQVLTRKKN